MSVAIVTDSTCDLPPEVVSEYDITVVPLTVFFGDEAFLDGVDISADAFYERQIAFRGSPRTSQPSVEQFRSVYQRLAAATKEIVSIHISSRMSGTLNSASIAREELAGEVHIDLVDSYNVSMGLGAVVLAAAEAAKAGGSLTTVVDAARRTIDRTHVIAAVDTLEYLRKGGRIGRASALLGSLLSIKPIIHIERGELAPLERVRTHARAVERLVQLATADQRLKRLFVAGAADEEGALDLMERVRPSLPHTDIRLGQLGPVVGVHSGPGLLGICTVARD